MAVHTNLVDLAIFNSSPKLDINVYKKHLFDKVVLLLIHQAVLPVQQLHLIVQRSMLVWLLKVIIEIRMAI
jgi:hypothetical protein